MTPTMMAATRLLLLVRVRGGRAGVYIIGLMVAAD